MYSKEDILKQLNAGVSAEKIAKDMVDALNSAIEEFDNQKEAAANRKKARNAVDAIVDYFQVIGYDSVPEKERERLTDMLETIAKPEVDDNDILKAFLKTLE